jgi:hypothetical protein
VQPAAAPGSAAASGAPTSQVSRPEEAPLAAIEPKPSKPKATDIIWKLKNGKMQGPGQAAPKVIGTFKDPKSGAVTVTSCWKYPDFAITESKTKGEVGAGEAFLRHSSKGGKEDLCAAEFSGKSDELKIIEGYFAGVAGDYVFIEGADVGEGLPQFQIISTKSATEAFKGVHHPTEEFTVTQRGHRVSLTFFSKVPVKCEIAAEGAECWKKVLAGLPSVKPTPMPECAAAFKNAKVALEESALVTVRAEVSDMAAPKLKILGGKATCQPAPQ